MSETSTENITDPTSQKIRVLYLDDEQANLDSFRATFRRDFEIFTTTSFAEAEEFLSKDAIQVLIVDQRMPIMTGVEFLESIIQKYPDPVRILLTGFSDIEGVINAINRAQVFKYLEKPWSHELLLGTVKQAYASYLLIRGKKEELDFFIYKTSHDLRGPLSSIKGLVDLASGETDNPEQIAFYLKLIEQSITQLMNTTNEFIEYKKIDQAGINKQDIDFNVIISQVQASLQNLNRYKDIEFRVNINQTEILKSDSSIIRSVMQNLIHNAIKFGRYDNPDVKPFISINVSNNEKHEMVIEIKDNGIGMMESVQKNIFNLFYRIENHSISGSGLGLYIVKKGLDKLNGKIDVQSEINLGTTFTITLPHN